MRGRKKGVQHVARHKRLRIARELAARSPGEPYKTRRLNKDPGVPHLESFKKHIKRSEEQHTKRVAAQQERRKLSRSMEIQHRRNLHSFHQDVLKRQQDFDHKVTTLKDLENTAYLKTENSRKAYYKEFRKVVEIADVVLEVLDCRDPLGCRAAQAEQAVLQAGPRKRLVLVLNKIDLVPKDVVAAWLQYFRSELPTVVFKASTQTQAHHLQRSRVKPVNASPALLASSACVGAEGLMKLLGSYCRNQDIRTTITVGVIGFPNVGKSSLINSLKRQRSCPVGATPGITKCMQEVHLDKHIKLLDSPGVVMGSGAGSKITTGVLALQNCLKTEQLMDPVTPALEILRRCDQSQLQQRYNVSSWREPTEFLSCLARRLGKLKRGGRPNLGQAARVLLSDWNSGRISFYTHPPEVHTLPSYLSAEIVTELSQAFDIDSLIADDGALFDSLPSMQVKRSEIPSMETSLAVSCCGDREEEEVEMEDERRPMSVEVPLRKTKVSDTSGQPSARPRGWDALESVRDAPVLQQGQALAIAGKQRKKKQKRADKLSTKLSDRLTEAMNLL
uniref:guanine nucleotide-binding protein-like 3-like protein n=1 Tax=Myxine glutinosa TaxID=7769 RepID=UPI00358E6555